MSKNNEVDFIGIGAGKAGSTWVAKCLSGHPEICMAPQKEIRFFNSSNYKAEDGGDYAKNNFSNYKRGVDWYLEQFPVQNEKIKGEFSPNYWMDAEAHSRIKRHFPNVKLIIVLRNPVEKVYSLYNWWKESIDVEVSPTFKESIDNDEFVLDKGLYYKHLKKFFDVFNYNKMHVIIHDDIKNNPKGVMRRLYRFLDVNQDVELSIFNKKINSAIKTKRPLLGKCCKLSLNLIRKCKLNSLADKIVWNSKIYKIYAKLNLTKSKYKKMDEESRFKLKKYFRSDIENLEKLIDRDLSMWK